MPPSRLIFAVAADWVHELDHAKLSHVGEFCRRCAGSDLVLQQSVSDWPHDALHRLVAPIEEIIDAAVEAYLDTDRDERLDTIDDYRSRLRTTARTVVDHALMHRRAFLLDMAG